MKSFFIVAFLGVAFGVSSSSAQAQEKYQTDGLKSHNAYRANHNAPALTLDDTLNKAALECAKYYAAGNTAHTCPQAKGYGENIAGSMSSAGAPSFDSAMSSGIKRWYDENKDYDYDDNTKSRGVTGHFTQVVWIGSKKLGLGCASGTDKWTRCVAIYSPPGNVKGQYKQNVLRGKNKM